MDSYALETLRILRQAAEIRRLREQMTLVLAEIERYHNVKVVQLEQDIIAIEKRIAVREAENELHNA